MSVFLNIKNQYLTLKEAENKNYLLEEKIENLKIEKQRLIRKIEYATNSAFINQQIHDKLSLGTVNDVWIIMPTETQIDLRPQANEDKKQTNWQQWLNLFTQ